MSIYLKPFLLFYTFRECVEFFKMWSIILDRPLKRTQTQRIYHPYLKRFMTVSKRLKDED